jgi:hypothetical protein
LATFIGANVAKNPKIRELKSSTPHGAGQLALSYVCGMPTKAKTDSQDIFEELFNEAFDPDITTAETIIAAHSCYEIIERKRQLAIAFQKRVNKNSFSETWIIEGHFHVLFVVGELMRRRCIELNRHDIACELIDEAIKIVSIFSGNHPSASAYRLFRSSNSISEIRAIIEREDAIVTTTPVQLSLDL